MNAYQFYQLLGSINTTPFEAIVRKLDECSPGGNNCVTCLDYRDCLGMFDQRADYRDVICRHCGNIVANYHLCPACGGILEKKKGGINGD